MSDKKISQLPASSLPLTGTEELPLVQGGVTKKATVQDVANLAGSPYKVYTALLTQGGGDGISYIENFSTSGVQNIIKGVTYRIDVNSENVDFSSIGAPSNAEGTHFVATANAVNTDFADSVWALEYNTGAPVVIVLENTIGNIWWTYDSVGTYRANSSSSFTTDKKFLIHKDFDWLNSAFVQSSFNSVNDVIITSYDATTIPSPVNFDGVLYSFPIEIRVYN